MFLLLCPANIPSQAAHTLESDLHASSFSKAYLASAFAVKQSQRSRSLAVISRQGTGYCPAFTVCKVLKRKNLMALFLDESCLSMQDGLECNLEDFDQHLDLSRDGEQLA